MSLYVDIEKSFSDFKLKISFETDSLVTGLLGASGSGKSITLRCIAGIIKPDKGSIILNNRVLFDSAKKINLTPQQRKVGYLFQNYALFPNMTVRQNILCGLYHEKSRQKKEYELKNIVSTLQLNGLENLKPHQLSGGQQQRTSLARILIGNPEILALDEPFSALDTFLRGQLQIEIQKIIKTFQKETILVTHDRDEAYRLCGKIALIDKGNLIVHKETKELFANPESKSAALLTGCKNIVSAKKTGEYEITIPDWNVNFKTSEKVNDKLIAVGIHSHHFIPNLRINSHNIMVIDKIEDPFEYIIQFRYKSQKENTNAIWCSISKENLELTDKIDFGIDPSNILLLYK